VRGIGDVTIREIPFAAMAAPDLAGLRKALDADTLAVVLGQPNVFGVLEDVTGAAELATPSVPYRDRHGRSHSRSRSSARRVPRRRCRRRRGHRASACPSATAGPGVGLFATHERHVRSMPGRIVGETVDARGRRGFVLTLATREQHIRRERATSNICTNQGLCALAVAIPSLAARAHGLRAVAALNYRAAHAGGGPPRDGWGRAALRRPLLQRVRGPGPTGTLGGARAGRRDRRFPLARWYPELEDALLLCVTEAHATRDVDRLVRGLTAPAVRAART